MQTMVSEGDVASAVVIAGNKIVYAGDDSGIDAFAGDNTQAIDLDGKFVSPGSIDGHIHAPGNWFTKLYQIDLTGLSTNEEYLEAIRSFVEAHPEEEGYIGSPFMLNAHQLPDGSNPGPLKEDTEQLTNPRTQAPRDPAVISPAEPRGPIYATAQPLPALRQYANTQYPEKASHPSWTHSSYPRMGEKPKEYLALQFTLL